MGVENDIERGRQIAERLKHELHIAQSSWAHFEAINGKTEFTRQQLRQANEWFRLSVTHQNLLQAIIRDAILALWRILDSPKKDRFTLAEVSKLLDSKKVRDALIQDTHTRISHLPGGTYLRQTESEIVHQKIVLIRNHIPNQWNSNNRPKTKWMIYDVREIFLKKLRHQVLAHAGYTYSIDNPTANQLRYAIRRIDTLVSAAHHIFVGSPLDYRSLHKLEDEANKFWDYAQAGFVDALKRDEHRLRSFNG